MVEMVRVVSSGAPNKVLAESREENMVTIYSRFAHTLMIWRCFIQSKTPVIRNVGRFHICLVFLFALPIFYGCCYCTMEFLKLFRTVLLVQTREIVNIADAG